MTLFRSAIYTKSKKIAKSFYIQKPGHFAKSKTISVTFLYTGSKKLYFTQFLMKLLRSAFNFKKHDTLRYVMFLYTKSRTFRKKQDNLHCVLYTKSGHLLNFFNWRRWGELFIYKNECTMTYIFIWFSIHTREWERRGHLGLEQVIPHKIISIVYIILFLPCNYSINYINSSPQYIHVFIVGSCTVSD